jgi:hypothetical protein
MSKVGSSSVYYSLKSHFPNKTIKHVHFLGPTWLGYFKNGHHSFNNNLQTAEYINNLIEKKPWKLKIITLTREPVARDISGIFQAWKHIFDVDDINKVPSKDILKYLHENNFGYAQNWFETDFYEFTGLNLFNSTFNKDKGFQIYKTDKADVLVIQLERLNSTLFNEAMNSFFGKGKYFLKNENITSNRETATLNKTVKQQFRLSEERLNSIYDSRYMKTFYNASQIDSFKKQWSNQ